MREILFRGKRKDNGEWVEGLLWKKKYDTPKLFISCFPDEDDNEEVFVIYPETVGQYTGLTDKNGTKIFEGDIIQDYIEPKPKGIIRFGEYETPYKEWTQISTYTHSKHIGFFIEWRNGVFRKDLRFWNEKIEIIGNIHDNPELLAGGDCNG